MRKTLTLTLATALLAAGLAHACPPRRHRPHDRVSTRQLIHAAREAQLRGVGLEYELEADLAARAARDYSAARRLLAPPRQSLQSLRLLVIELKTAKLKK